MIYMKYSGHALFVLLVAGMVLSACISKPGDQTARITSTATAEFGEIKPFPEPSPKDSGTTLLESSSSIDTQDLETTSTKEAAKSSLEITYSQDNPLTDPDEILRVLEALKQRHIEWLSRPGWYVYLKFDLDGPVLTGTYFIDDQGNCTEQFQFKNQEGQFLPRWVRLADGTYARLYNQIGPYDQAQYPPKIFFPDEGESCKLEDDVAFDLINLGLEKQIRLADYRNGNFEVYDLRLWKEILDEQEVIVLYEDAIQAPPLPLMRRPDGEGWVPIRRNQQWLYLDPLSGGQVGVKAASYAENGELVDGDASTVWKSDNLFSAELPEDVARAYWDVIEALRSYLGDLDLED